MPGNEMPIERELKVRFSQKPPTEAEGSSAARACRTRASASVVRKLASATTGTSPEASRTASANDNRSGAVGAGACAARGTPMATSHASTATSRELLLRDAMEIQVDVSVEILLDVERLGHAGSERVPRDHRVHQRRHGELRGNHDVYGTELSVLDAALDHAGHEAVPARHDFLVVETCELGKSCRLGHHELRDSGHRRLPHQPPVFPHQLLEQLAGAAGKRLGEGFTLRDDRHDGFSHHGLEQGFLAVEVEVDGAFGYTGTTRHVGELRRGEPALSKHLQRGGHDLSRPGVLTTLPAGLRLALRWSDGVAHSRSIRS